MLNEREYERTAAQLRPSLEKLAYGLLGSRDAAQDVAQEAIIEGYLCENYDRPDYSPNNLAPLLKTITRRLANARRFSAQEKREVNASEYQDEANTACAWFDHTAARRDSANENATRARVAEARERVRRARLSPRQAEILALRVNGLSIEQIAACLQIHTRSVDDRIYRANKRLNAVNMQEGPDYRDAEEMFDAAGEVTLYTKPPAFRKTDPADLFDTFIKRRQKQNFALIA